MKGQKTMDLDQYLYSKMVKTPSKSYYFDVCINQNGNKIVKIVKSYRYLGKIKRKSMSLLDDEVELFLGALSELKPVLESDQID